MKSIFNYPYGLTKQNFGIKNGFYVCRIGAPLPKRFILTFEVFRAIIDLYNFYISGLVQVPYSPKIWGKYQTLNYQTCLAKTSPKPTPMNRIDWLQKYIALSSPLTPIPLLLLLPSDARHPPSQ